MKQILIGILFLLILSFKLTSCSPVISALYGIKRVKSVDERTILHYGEKYNIPNQDNFELDTAYYLFLRSMDTAKFKLQIQNHYQPLQALYYDKGGYLQSFHVNCYAGGFPNLKWGRNGLFSTFPPKQQTPVDSIVGLDKQINYLNQLSLTKKIFVENSDYIVIVYWSRFMGRQSKRLIKTVQKNEKLATDKKVKLIYANTDNLYAIEDQKVKK